MIHGLSSLLVGVTMYSSPEHGEKDLRRCCTGKPFHIGFQPEAFFRDRKHTASVARAFRPFPSIFNCSLPMLFAGKVCSLLIARLGQLYHLRNTLASQPGTSCSIVLLYFFLTCAIGLRVTARKWSDRISKKSCSIPQYLPVLIHFFTILSSKRGHTSPPPPPFSSIHRTAQKSSMCAHFSVHSQAQWRGRFEIPARSICTFSPRATCFNISIKSGILSNFFFACVQDKSSAHCFWRFQRSHPFLNLMELLLRIFVETFSACNGFFYPSHVQWSVESVCESLPVNHLMRRIPKSRQSLDFVTPFNFKYFFHVPEVWASQNVKRTNLPIYLLLF